MCKFILLFFDFYQFICVYLHFFAIARSTDAIINKEKYIKKLMIDF